MNHNTVKVEHNQSSPRVESVEVIPVAGCDRMLLNLSGAHAPFFTRNLIRLRDSSGRTGVGEVPGGEPYRSRHTVGCESGKGRVDRQLQKI